MNRVGKASRLEGVSTPAAGYVPAGQAKRNYHVRRSYGRREAFTASRALAEEVESASSERKFNFSAGPAMLPLDVLEEVQHDLVSYKGSGMSVLEMSHRSKEFVAIAEGAEESLRELMDIPDNYEVLFMQGGASTQFSAIPLNLTSSSNDAADYVTTGSWSKKYVGPVEFICDLMLDCFKSSIF